MRKVFIALDLLLTAGIRHWLGLFYYLLGCALYRATGVRLFEERVLKFKPFAIVGSVKGMSGLTFMHEIHNRDTYRFDEAASDESVRNVFDVGANCGFFSLHHAQRHPTWQLWSFEPHPQTFERLEKNITANAWQNRIHPVHAAVGSRQGMCEIEFEATNSMAVLSEVVSDHRNLTSVTVPMTMLDEFSARENVKPDYIKIDVEGFELEVLKGAVECLKSARYVILEYHSQELLTECSTFLEARGFQIAHRAELLLCSRRAS